MILHRSLSITSFRENSLIAPLRRRPHATITEECISITPQALRSRIFSARAIPRAEDAQGTMGKLERNRAVAPVERRIVDISCNQARMGLRARTVHARSHRS